MGVYDVAKDVANTLKEAGKIEEYTKILDLIADCFEYRKKIDELEEQIKILDRRLSIVDEVTFKNNAYWKIVNSDGPYCSRCLDKNKDLIRIIPRNTRTNHAECPECKNSYNFGGKEDVAQTYIPSHENWS